MNNVADASVVQQWLWGYFNAISAMLLVTYGVRTCVQSGLSNLMKPEPSSMLCVIHPYSNAQCRDYSNAQCRD